MTMTHGQALVTILLIALATVLTRALPFLLFPDRREPPALVKKLGAVLPYAMIGLLVVYSLKDVAPAAWPYGLPEAASLLLVFLLHRWKKNTLVSIAGGTALYMLLSQLVFV